MPGKHLRVDVALEHLLGIGGQRSEPNFLAKAKSERRLTQVSIGWLSGKFALPILVSKSLTKARTSRLVSQTETSARPLHTNHGFDGKCLQRFD